ncbi:uncharacterized protein B0I36DRAFT_436596 [Microdochium trichocladiopsis]|uniref:BTB domain-containing protein n=1 Tax=Microdochium trichocladiopsis TaxID=1682393 RepID=A0A9P9BHX2_9PEZI|nr:uncharacterized protein B0I36DRAFT_436596 [Microdochium trichocladiopsis]KAH7012520.1 hypothetical protein B0I36DRAFT_436596 [Microdochium trichocladiopsis]
MPWISAAEDHVDGHTIDNRLLTILDHYSTTANSESISMPPNPGRTSYISGGANMRAGSGSPLLFETTVSPERYPSLRKSRAFMKDYHACTKVCAGLLGTAFTSTPSLPTTDAPQRELHSAIASLHLNELYSDLIIASTTKSYPVHKVVVCTRSDFIAGWCRSDRDEVADGILSLPNDDPLVVDAMIQYFYRLDYAVPVEQAQDQEDAGLLFHAKVYTLAEMYLVRGLKELAVVKFKTASLSQNWNTQGFLDAAKEAYTSTPETVRTLRQVVLETFAMRKELLDKEETQEVIKGTDGLAYDILFHFHQTQYNF